VNIQKSNPRGLEPPQHTHVQTLFHIPIRETYAVSQSMRTEKA